MSQSPQTRDDTIDLGPRQVFRSAEHVVFDVPIAGPASRILAYGIDTVCVGLVLVGVVAALLLATPLADWAAEWLAPVVEEVGEGDVAELGSSWLLYGFALLIVLQFVLEWFYFVLLEILTGGRSVGKALLGLRVQGDGGMPLTPGASLTRNLLRIVDVLPLYYLTGLVSMVLSADGKRLGDHAAGTIVVRLDRPPPAPPLSLDPADADFRFEREQIAALGPTERTLLRQTLRRLDALAEPHRAQAIERAAEALRRRIGYRDLAPAEREPFLRALWWAARRGN